MAAKTPDSVIIENFGSNTMYKCTFGTTSAHDIDNGDTYTVTPLTNVVSYWCSPTDAPTQTHEGIDVGYAQTTGVFTFSTGEDNRTGDLFILAKS
jgi:hypothetical protein